MTEERRCLYKTWPHKGSYLMCCNYFVDRFHKRKIEGKRGPFSPARVAQERYIDFYLARKILMDGLVRGKWTSRLGYPYQRRTSAFVRETKARFAYLIENEIASLGSMKTQFGLPCSEFCGCLKMCEALSITKCSRSRVENLYVST